MKRFFDIISSFLVLIIFSPFFIIISILIVLESKGGILYRQTRIGKNEIPFTLYKFRSMKAGSDKKGLLTIGTNDTRITRMGKFIRKTKLDEIPQLINVIKGDMSVVGPRPEVEKYVSLYTAEQKKVLLVRPGLTDYASIHYIEENKYLEGFENAEQVYLEKIMPEKLNLNLKYIEEQNFFLDLKLIFKTIGKLLS